MMIRTIILLVGLITILDALPSSSTSFLIENQLVCTSRNTKYLNEYLYSSVNEYDTYIDYESKYVFKRHKLLTNNINSNSITDSKQLLWIFKKVEWLNSTFYIQNIISNYKYEHICASHIHSDQFYYRRRVNLNLINKHSLITNEKCMWKFIPSTDGSKNVYNIWNVYYDEPLYAANHFYKTAKSNSRAVFLWYSTPDSKQFNWEVYCD